jgi:hypothetical protein
MGIRIRNVWSDLYARRRGLVLGNVPSLHPSTRVRDDELETPQKTWRTHSLVPILVPPQNMMVAVQLFAGVKGIITTPALAG